MSTIPFDPFSRTLFGQPRTLVTLCLTEMWERFSYYGMRALLVLFMIAPTAEGGMGLGAAEAAGIYAVYVSLVYLTPLPGGWIGDRVLGPRRTVFVGGAVIAAGHIVLAIMGGSGLFIALFLIIIGTGLLKPNMTAMVGSLYAFGAAAVGMILALVQYGIGTRGMGSLGAAPENPLTPAERRRYGVGAAIGVVVAVAFVILDLLVLHVSANAIELGITLVILLVPIAWFTRTLRAERGNVEQRNRVLVLLVLFCAAAVFWLVYDQAGSTVAIFAQEDTQNTVLGASFPSSWFQSVNPLLIIALAPVMAIIWTALGVRGKQPGTAYKFAGGLLLVAISMGVMVFAAQAAIDGKVAAMWLIAVFAIQTVGELMLSPVGMAAATRLSPPNRVSQTLGVWFLATSVGDAIGGRLAQFYDSLGQAAFFGMLGLIALVATFVVLALARPLGRLVPD